MANNRMYLKHKHTGQTIYLAKYYPSTGWYMTTTVEAVNAAFDQSDFGHLTPEQREQNDAHQGLGVPYVSVGGMWGDDWEIEYEAISDHA